VGVQIVAKSRLTGGKWNRCLQYEPTSSMNG